MHPVRYRAGMKWWGFSSVLVFAAVAPVFADIDAPCMSTMDLPGRPAGARYVELKGVKWKTGQTLRILFMGGTAEERQLVRETAVEWTKYANLNFEFYDSREQLGNRNSDIRISFDKKGGSNSAVGTHATYYGQDDATMNFGWNSRKTILHEFGHMLGLKHEHQNPSAGIPWNRPLIYDYFAKQGWDKAKVDRAVFDELDVNTVNYSKYDKDSIMVYEFPASWTTNGMSAQRGDGLSEMDKIGIAKMYPGRKPGTVVSSEPVAVPVETPPTPVLGTVSDDTISVGSRVSCGRYSGVVERITGFNLIMKLDNGKRAAAPLKKCAIRNATATAPASPPAASGKIGEGDRVNCAGRSGVVVRTIGERLLVDFAGGQRQFSDRSACSVQ